VWGLSGCASSLETSPAEAAADLGPELPDDFSVDVTILAAEDESQAESRNARYILFPDGSLHHGAKPGKGPNTLPPVVRRLDRRQMQSVWRRARQLGLADPTTGDEPRNFAKVWTPWEGKIYLVAFTGAGHYWNFARKVEPGDQLDPALRSFLRDLAALAWAEDEATAAVAFDPKRYDYGPDPYKTYRENAIRANETSDE
jgi:hypothetical protein